MIKTIETKNLKSLNAVGCWFFLKLKIKLKLIIKRQCQKRWEYPTERGLLGLSFLVLGRGKFVPPTVAASISWHSDYAGNQFLVAAKLEPHTAVTSQCYPELCNKENLEHLFIFTEQWNITPELKGVSENSLNVNQRIFQHIQWSNYRVGRTNRL